MKRINIKYLYLLLALTGIFFFITKIIIPHDKDLNAVPVPDGPRLKDAAGSIWIGFYANSSTRTYRSENYGQGG